MLARTLSKQATTQQTWKPGCSFWLLNDPATYNVYFRDTDVKAIHELSYPEAVEDTCDLIQSQNTNIEQGSSRTIPNPVTE